MADLKLSQLRDRNPVKLSIAVMPDLHQALNDYAVLYATTYGRVKHGIIIQCLMQIRHYSDAQFNRIAIA